MSFNPIAIGAVPSTGPIPATAGPTVDTPIAPVGTYDIRPLVIPRGLKVTILSDPPATDAPILRVQGPFQYAGNELLIRAKSVDVLLHTKLQVSWRDTIAHWRRISGISNTNLLLRIEGVADVVAGGMILPLSPIPSGANVLDDWMNEIRWAYRGTNPNWQMKVCCVENAIATIAGGFCSQFDTPFTANASKWRTIMPGQRVPFPIEGPAIGLGATGSSLGPPLYPKPIQGAVLQPLGGTSRYGSFRTDQVTYKTAWGIGYGMGAAAVSQISVSMSYGYWTILTGSDLTDLLTTCHMQPGIFLCLLEGSGRGRQISLGPLPYDVSSGATSCTTGTVFPAGVDVKNLLPFFTTPMNIYMQMPHDWNNAPGIVYVGLQANFEGPQGVVGAQSVSFYNDWTTLAQNAGTIASGGRTACLLRQDVAQSLVVGMYSDPDQGSAASLT